MRNRSLFRQALLTTTALVAALTVGSRPAASAQLAGFQVQAGQVSLTTIGQKSVLTQSTNKSITAWSAFSIASGSSVQIVQPSTSAIMLARVTGNSVSVIQGALTANGQFWLVNPSGVFFGQGAQVNVGGLIATTADIRNEDFLSGNYKFGIGSANPNASIVNEGTIRVSPGGSAVLAGAQVNNQGLIVADLGTVVLGGAKSFTVDFQGDKLIQFQIADPVDQKPANGGALVSNSGTIAAQSGTVLLTARAAKNVIDQVINSTGIVEATSAQNVNGEIVFDGGDSGTVTVSGTLNASGASAGQTGGTVKVLGDSVHLTSGASIDVSGDAGGGTALIGGNFHGAGPEQNATNTTVDSGATINASATGKGNGGNVAVWSNGTTSFAGAITAQGGALGGNGGAVETSGKGQLAVTSTASVDTSAKSGATGSWLLDPTNATIGLSAGDINPLSIVQALTGTDVIIEASGNVFVDKSTGADLEYNSTHAFDLLAQQSIFVNAPVQNAGTGNVNLVAGWDGSTGLNASAQNSTVFAPGTLGGSSAALTFSISDVISANAFGHNGGSVQIGNGAQTSGVAVGSANGSVTIAAAFLTLKASTAAISGGYAQLGFNTAGTSLDTTGGITTSLTNGLVMQAGTNSEGSDNFAQIGQGGAASAGNNSGALQIAAGGSIKLQGGAGSGDYAQIGHGGLDQNQTSATAEINSGTITVNAANGALLMIAGSGADSYVQIGHGGLGSGNGATALIENSGDITVGAASVSLVSSAGGTGSYVQIGHGDASGGDGGAGGTQENGTINLTAGSKGTLFLSSSGVVAIGHRSGDATQSINSSDVIISAGELIDGAGTNALGTGTNQLGGQLLTDLAGGNVGFTLTGSGAAALTIAAPLAYSSANNLSIDSAGNLVVNANLLNTDNAGPGGVTLTSGGNLTVASGVTLGAGLGGDLLTASKTLSFGAGTVTVSGSLTAGGSTILLDGTMTSTGSQTYTGPVLLGANTTVDSSAGNIDFASTIENKTGNGLALVIAAESGTVTLGGSVGNTGMPLGSLDIAALTTTLSGGTIVTKSGTTSDGSISFTGAVLLTGDETIISNNGSQSYDGTIDGAHTLSLSPGTGNVTLAGAIGSATPLSALLVGGAGPGTTTLSGGVIDTSGTVSFSQDVALGSDMTLSSGGGDIAFARRINGDQSLSLSAGAGNVTFGGDIGGLSPLAALFVSGTGTTTLDGREIITTQSAPEFALKNNTALISSPTSGEVSLGEGVVLNSDMIVVTNGGAITFASTIDGAHHLLLVPRTGNVSLGGAIGAATPLLSLVVEGSGTATLSGGVIDLSGTVAQGGIADLAISSGFAFVMFEHVALGSDIAINTNNGSIRFDKSVDGPHSLVLSPGSGNVVFTGQNVGALAPLSALVIEGSGTTQLYLSGLNTTTANGAGSSGEIVFDQALELFHPLTITSNGGNVTFANTVDDNPGFSHPLSVTAGAGNIVFDTAIGAAVPLSGLTLQGNDITLNGIGTSSAAGVTGDTSITGNLISLNGGIYNTGGGQLYAGPVSLGGATTFNLGGDLTVTGLLSGNANVTILGTGADTFSSIALGAGTIDLSGKAGGSFTANGNVTAAGLVTSANPYSIALLGGATIGDPTLSNTGGVAFSGDFLFTNGLTVGSALTLDGATSIDTETAPIVLGTVNQGANSLVVVADAVTLNGAWSGTGSRSISPFSSLSIGLGDGVPGQWTLSTAELGFLAGGSPSSVSIGGPGAGPMTIGTFSFTSAPLTLEGNGITITGTLTSDLTLLAPGATIATSGAGKLILTGPLFVEANTVTINSAAGTGFNTTFIEGKNGAGAAGLTSLLGTAGSGPYMIDGVCFANAGCAPILPPGPVQPPNPNPIVFPQTPPPDTGPITQPDLGSISPAAGGDDNGDSSDQTIDELLAFLDAGPAAQDEPDLCDHRLMGNLLKECRIKRTHKSIIPDQDSDYSNWGNEARW